MARLLDVAAVLGAVAYLPSAYLSLISSLWVVLIVDTAAFAVVIGLSRIPRIPYKVKVAVFLALLYGLGLTLVLYTGPFGAGHLFLFCFVVLISLFGGVRPMVGGNLLALLTNACFAAASWFHLLPWVQTFDEVVVVSANFVLISAILSFAVHSLVGGYAKAADEEKRLRLTLELLLHEMEHRVKNNLQVISSLVNLRTKSNPDPAKVLTDIREILVAINVVHRLLYRRESFYLLELNSLLESLVESFRRLHGAIEYRLEWDGPPLEIDGERAVSFGILINEIVMNSAKHAFSGGSGLVTIEAWCRLKEKSLQLVIADNGRGMDAAANPAGSGIAIIKSLSKHLGAELEVQGTKGVRYSLQIKIPDLVGPEFQT